MSDLASLVRLEDPNFYLDDPHPVLQRIRREDPVFYYEPLDMWVMSKYEDIRHVGLLSSRNRFNRPVHSSGFSTGAQ